MNFHLRFSPYFKIRLHAVLNQKTWDAAQLLEQQNHLFQKLFQHAIRHTDFYPRLYAAHGVNLNTIQSIEDIHTLPVVTKQHLRDHLHELYIGNPWAKVKGRTSGTTGMPTTVYRDYASVIEEGAYLWAQRYLFGYEPGMKTVSLRGDLDRRLLGKRDPHNNTLYLSSFNMKPERIDWYYERICKFLPYAIVAYPSSIEILANFFQERGYTLHVPYVFTSSEKVHEYQRRKIEQVFQTKIVDWYGNSERTIALEQRLDNHYYELPLYSFNEYKATHTLSTGFINFSLPLIRYQVDDVIQKGEHPADDFKVSSVMGRSDDFLVLPDGTKIGRTGAFFLDVHGLSYAQIIQQHRDHFNINIVANNRFNNDSMDMLRKNIREFAGEHLHYNVRFIQQDEIIRTQAGKFKMVISSLPDA